MKKPILFKRFEAPAILQTIEMRRAMAGQKKKFEIDEIFDHNHKDGQPVAFGKKKKKKPKEAHGEIFPKKKAFSYDYQKY